MEEKDEKYEFVTETIKKPPINKRKLLKKVITTILLAILFGVIATFTVLLLFPRLQAYMYPQQDTRPVSLPVEITPPDDEPVEPFVAPEHDNPADQTEGGKEDENPLTKRRVPMREAQRIPRRKATEKKSL